MQNNFYHVPGHIFGAYKYSPITCQRAERNGQSDGRHHGRAVLPDGTEGQEALFDLQASRHCIGWDNEIGLVCCIHEEASFYFFL